MDLFAAITVDAGAQADPLLRQKWALALCMVPVSLLAVVLLVQGNRLAVTLPAAALPPLVPGLLLPALMAGFLYYCISHAHAGLRLPLPASYYRSNPVFLFVTTMDMVIQWVLLRTIGWLGISIPPAAEYLLWFGVLQHVLYQGMMLLGPRWFFSKVAATGAAGAVRFAEVAGGRLGRLLYGPGKQFMLWADVMEHAVGFLICLVLLVQCGEPMAAGLGAVLGLVLYRTVFWPHAAS